MLCRRFNWDKQFVGHFEQEPMEFLLAPIGQRVPNGRESLRFLCVQSMPILSETGEGV